MPLPDVAPADLGASLGIAGVDRPPLAAGGRPLEDRTAAVVGGAGALGHAAVQTRAVGNVLVDVSPAT